MIGSTTYFVNLFPLDNNAVSTAISTATKMSIVSFTTPWNWGKSYSLTNVVRYSLSDINGKLYTMTAPVNANDWTVTVPVAVSCVVTAMAQKFRMSNDTTNNIADAQKVGFNVKTATLIKASSF